MYTAQLSFCTVYRQRQAIPRDLRQILSRAYVKNCRLFRAKPSNLRVVICDSSAELKRASKSYYVSFASGVVLADGTLVLRSRRFAKVGKKRYEELATHEMNHVFWQRLNKRKRSLWEPLWLCEGIALLASNDSNYLRPERLQRRLRGVRVDSRLLYERFSASRFKSRAQVRMLYTLWGQFTGYLFEGSPVRCAGFLKLVLSSSGRGQFRRIFLRHFRQTPEQAFKMFVRSLPT